MSKLKVRKYLDEPLGAQWRVSSAGAPGDAAFESWAEAMRFVNRLIRSVPFRGWSL